MKARLSRENIAARIARELEDGYCVNLGVGIPLMVCSFIPADKTIIFHAENGVIGYGPVLTLEDADKMDYDLVNAFGQFIAPLPGLCVVDHASSFALVRGGRLDISVLGALQVSQGGDLANWTTDHNWRQTKANLGGAMDIAVGANKVIAAMAHTTKDGQPKIVKKLTYPLTARQCVNLIVSDLAVLEVVEAGLLLREVAPGWTAQEVQALTEAPLVIDRDLTEIEW
ncbi:3-oxoacid CoA-transferase subunit B [Chloroflexota bacterium]